MRSVFCGGETNFDFMSSFAIHGDRPRVASDAPPGFHFDGTVTLRAGSLVRG